ncbi:FAD-dependent monooxygenase [Paraburkholderia silviterrae]|uniref:FAD-binding domain-containing protein n=1 Tax=Paraburkholderia silviterrae TaxID=2528715 RepID=A0A4R5LZ54_9BURK|nr:FAD-dependent monooxygenase [Paraburkholderia silviterrae]TDG17742.1 hypothetical protein EYW47_36595 [Paraburkholderia silviterrae]
MLFVQRLDIREDLCGGIEGRLSCISTSNGIPLQTFPGQPITVQLETDSGPLRSIRVIVTDANEGESDGSLATCQLVTDFPFRFHLPQHYLSTVLLNELRQQPNVEIRLGETLQSVEASDESVRLVFSTENGRRESRASWVVGVDGAHSMVRKTAGFSFDGFTWPEKFLVTNVRDLLEALGYTGMRIVCCRASPT